MSPDGKSVYVASFTSDAVARLNRNVATGAITQPAGTAYCISETGAGPCADGHALDGVTQVAVSPDGKSVYAASALSDAVVRLARNTTTGAITQPAGPGGCVSETGAGTCADGHALDYPQGVKVSRDGKSVYAASTISDAVVRFARNTTTGAITQPAGPGGCISETGAGACADGHALDSVGAVAVSRDGKSVYATSVISDAVVRFARNTTTGAITQPAGPGGCVSETGAGTCADGHALNAPTSVAASPDGKSVYVGSFEGHAVARLNRDPTTGALTQPAGPGGCVSHSGFATAAEPCADGHALVEVTSVVVSPDGKNVYAAASGWWAVARFNRNTTTEAITQPPGTDGCVSEFGSGGCTGAHGLESPTALAISGNGKNVYATSVGYSAVARLSRAP